MRDPLSPIRSTLRPPGSLNQLNSRIRQYSDANGLDVRRLNQRICTEVLFGTLERAKNAGIIELYLAKGGMALEIRFGIRARASRDIDIGILASGTDLVEIFDRALAVGFDDFTLERSGGARILENVATYRFAIKIKYTRRPFGTIDVDLNEASYETATTIEQTSFLTALGLPGPLDVPLLDPYLQLAHKLHGATEPSRLDYTNRRYRDVLDVLIMSSSDHLQIDYPRLRATAVEEFARREHHREWPPVIALPAEWHGPLTSEAADLGLAPSDAESIVRRFTSFVARIEGVSVRQTHEYQFLSFQTRLTGEQILADEQEVKNLARDGWRIIHIGPRQGYQDQMFAVLERALDENKGALAIPRLELRLAGRMYNNQFTLEGALRNESSAPANRVRVFVTGVRDIRTFGTITKGDGEIDVSFRIENEALRTTRSDFPSVNVQYAADDGTRFEQIGRLNVEGPDASGRFTYQGEGLGPSVRIDRFTHPHHPLEDL